MYRRFATWIAPSGVEVRYMVPSVTSELLPMEHAIETRLGAMYRDPDNAPTCPPLDDVQACARWARAFVVGERHDLDDLFDYALSPDATVALAVTIFNEASLKVAEVEAIRKLVSISASGGCECRICTGQFRDGEAPTEHDLSLCRYGEVSRATSYLVETAVPFMSSVDMNLPWSVFETVRLIRAENAKVAVARSRDAERKRRVDEKLNTRRPR